MVSNTSAVQKYCSSPEPHDIITVGAKRFRRADNEIRLAGSEFEGMQSVMKPEKLVLFPQVAHTVTVPASSRLCNFGLRRWTSFLIHVVFLHEPCAGAS